MVLLCSLNLSVPQLLHLFALGHSDLLHLILVHIPTITILKVMVMRNTVSFVTSFDFSFFSHLLLQTSVTDHTGLL